MARTTKNTECIMHVRHEHKIDSQKSRKEEEAQWSMVNGQPATATNIISPLSLSAPTGANNLSSP